MGIDLHDNLGAEAWEAYDRARKQLRAKPELRDEVARLRGSLVSMGFDAGRVVLNTRDGFEIEDPKVIYSVKYSDGTQTPCYGTDWKVGDVTEVTEYITGIERKVALPDVMAFCLDNDAVLVVELPREKTVNLRKYPDVAAR